MSPHIPNWKRVGTWTNWAHVLLMILNFVIVNTLDNSLVSHEVIVNLSDKGHSIDKLTLL